MKRLGTIYLLLLLVIFTTTPIQSVVGSNDTYVVTLYHSGDFTVFLSDVDIMFREGRLFSVKVSSGRISEVVIATQYSMSRVMLEEKLIPSKSMDGILYEFSGYLLRAFTDHSSFLQTAVLQGRELFLHTICLNTNFTLIITFFNGSAIHLDKAMSFPLKPIVIAFQDMFLAFALQDGLASTSVEASGNDVKLVIRSNYSCLTLIGLAMNSLSKLLEALNRISLEECYSYLEDSRYVYSRYVSMLPAVGSSIKQFNDLYYTALYNRLNTMLYPEIYNLSRFEKLVAYWISIEMMLTSNTTIAKKVAQHIFDVVKPTTIREAFIYLKLAKLVEDMDRVLEICNIVLPTVQSDRGVLDILIIDGIEQICGEKIYSHGISLDTVNLSIVDILALSRLKLTRAVELVTIRDIKPHSPWSCLAFVEALQQEKLYIHEVLSIFSLNSSFYPCLDYVVLRGMAGIDVEYSKLRIKPSIPKMLNWLSVKMVINGKELILSYSGWGGHIKNIKLNNIFIDGNSIPLDNLSSERTNEIYIEMYFPAPVAVEVAVLYNGVALEGIPIYVDVIGLGTRYSAVSITDSMGKTIFTIPPNSFINILINSTEIGLVQLRTKVGEEDREITIDLARDFSGPKDIVEKLNSIEMKLQRLEDEIRLNTPRPPDYVDRTNILFSSLALLASIIAIALAVTEIRR